MRLINADALMEHVYRDRLDNRELIAEMVRNAPTIAPESGWISCEERLPEEKQDVLLLMPHNMVVGFWEDVLNDGGRTWYANSGDGYFTDMDVLNGYDDPIAWTPLPLAPYREEVQKSDQQRDPR